MCTRGCLVLLLFALACGGPASDVQGPAAERAAARAGGDDGVGLASLVPAEASVVLRAPGYRRLLAMFMSPLPGDAERTLRARAGGEIEGAIGLSAADAEKLIDGFGPTAAFILGRDGAVIVEVAEGAPMQALLALPLLEALPDASGPGAIEVFGKRDQPSVRVAWLADRRLFVFATAPAPLEAVLERTRGRGAAFAEEAEPDAVTLHVDLSALAALTPGTGDLRGWLGEGSRLSGHVRAEPEGVRSRFELRLRGPEIPALGAHLVPSVPRLPARFPAETVSFLSLSLARQSGHGLRDVVAEIARAAGQPRAVQLIEAAAKSELGFGMDAIDAALGDELAVGLVADPDAKLERGPEGLLDQGAVVVALAWRDPALAERLIAKLGPLLAAELKDSHRVTAAGGSLRLDPRKPDRPAMQLSVAKDALLFRIGGARGLERTRASFDRGEQTLGQSETYQRLRQPAASVSGWVNAVRLGQLLRQEHALPSGYALSGRARLGPATKGLDVVLEGENGIETALVGVAAAVAVYSVRRYLAASKAAEAKNMVGAIARSAIAAFEREHAGGATHQLCGSAPPVPSQVPAGIKHQPGDDFDSGDERAGWRCLRFRMTMPHRYQYEYRRGGPYKGPARGGPDPGPHGFEASAEGDLDGDGVTSLFTLVGKVDARTKQLKVSPTLFVVDEFE